MAFEIVTAVQTPFPLPDMSSPSKSFANLSFIISISAATKNLNTHLKKNKNFEKGEKASHRNPWRLDHRPCLRWLFCIFQCPVSPESPEECRNCYRRKQRHRRWFWSKRKSKRSPETGRKFQKWWIGRLDPWNPRRNFGRRWGISPFLKRGLEEKWWGRGDFKGVGLKFEEQSKGFELLFPPFSFG